MKNKTEKNWLFIFTIAIFVGALTLFFYVKVFDNVASLEKNSDIDPEDAAIVNFPIPVLFKSYANEIKLEPVSAADFRWENRKKLVITPKKFWDPEKNYKIILPEGRTILFSKIKNSELNFSTVKYPKVSGISPADGAKDVLLDIEDPIVIDFDKSAQGFFMDFVLDPANQVTYENNPGKTQFKLLPKESVRDGQRYNLKIYAKYVGKAGLTQAPNNGSETIAFGAGAPEYKEIYSGSFETFSPASIIWEKDFALRLDQAKKYTRPKIFAGKYIDINLSQQIMSTFENGKILNSYLISSGKRGMETPKGNFKIENKAPLVWSKTYGLFMPWWNAIVPSGKFGIHELPEWPGGYKEGANHLGIPVSHGCMRLGVGPAKIIYDWAPIGTPLVIY